MECENCTCAHDGSYASGRFCSERCARSFSSKNKRLEINKKISQKLKGTHIGLGRTASIDQCLHTSEGLKKYYLEHPEAKDAISKRLTGRSLSESTKRKISLATKGKTGGFRENSVKHYKYSYYKGNRMDSSWEEQFARRLDELGIKWLKNRSVYFEYSDLNAKTRKYFPDFFLPERQLWVEITGYTPIEKTYKLQHSSQNSKINLVILSNLNDINTFS
jgi:hypothetical protein